MATTQQKAISAGGVLVGIATAVVTNLITSRWTWTLAAALAVLAAAGIWLALLASTSSGTGRTRHRIRAGHDGRIENSGATGREGADVRQTATRGGVITGSPVTAHNADVDLRADHGGRIADSPSDMR